MIFSNTDLIDQPSLVRATRQMVSDLMPSAGRPNALSTALDHAQVLAALKLALADLDASDPLDVIRTIDVQAHLGQVEPLVKVSTRHYGALVQAVYAGEFAEANQVPFDIAGAYQVRLHTTLRQPALYANPMLWVIIRWPRSPGPIPLSERPTALPHFADVRCVLSSATSDPARLSNTDGVALTVGERCLACLGAGDDAPANGIYRMTETGLQRAPDAIGVSDFSPDKVVCVMEGDTYADTVWQVTREPLAVGTSPIEFKCLTYPTNVDAAQAAAHVIPRAAAYLAAQFSVQTSDKNQAQKCADWATAILARPLPTHAEAVSHRAQTATEYAAS
jgi:hypothetical protein